MKQNAMPQVKHISSAAITIYINLSDEYKLRSKSSLVIYDKYGTSKMTLQKLHSEYVSNPVNETIF